MQKYGYIVFLGFVMMAHHSCASKHDIVALRAAIRVAEDQLEKAKEEFSLAGIRFTQAEQAEAALPSQAMYQARCAQTSRAIVAAYVRDGATTQNFLQMHRFLIEETRAEAPRIAQRQLTLDAGSALERAQQLYFTAQAALQAARDKYHAAIDAGVV